MFNTGALAGTSDSSSTSLDRIIGLSRGQHVERSPEHAQAPDAPDVVWDIKSKTSGSRQSQDDASSPEGWQARFLKGVLGRSGKQSQSASDEAVSENESGEINFEDPSVAELLQQLSYEDIVEILTVQSHSLSQQRHKITALENEAKQYKGEILRTIQNEGDSVIRRNLAQAASSNSSSQKQGIKREKSWKPEDFNWLTEAQAAEYELGKPLLLPAARHQDAESLLRDDFTSQVAEVFIDWYLVEARWSFRRQRYVAMMESAEDALQMASMVFENYPPLLGRCRIYIAIALMCQGRLLEAKEHVQAAWICTGKYPEGEVVPIWAQKYNDAISDKETYSEERRNSRTSDIIRESRGSNSNSVGSSHRDSQQELSDDDELAEPPAPPGRSLFDELYDASEPEEDVQSVGDSQTAEDDLTKGGVPADEIPQEEQRQPPPVNSSSPSNGIFKNPFRSDRTLEPQDKTTNAQQNPKHASRSMPDARPTSRTPSRSPIGVRRRFKSSPGVSRRSAKGSFDTLRKRRRRPELRIKTDIELAKLKPLSPYLDTFDQSSARGFEAFAKHRRLRPTQYYLTNPRYEVFARMVRARRKRRSSEPAVGRRMWEQAITLDQGHENESGQHRARESPVEAGEVNGGNGVDVEEEKASTWMADLPFRSLSILSEASVGAEDTRSVPQTGSIDDEGEDRRGEEKSGEGEGEGGEMQEEQ